MTQARNPLTGKMASAREERRSRTPSSRLVQGMLALAGYGAAALLIFGRTVVTAPSTTVVGDAGADKTIPMWSFVWWPHAIGVGHDPFDANVVWAPHGIDLAWVTSMPGVSLLGYPLTALAGPVVAYNVLALAGCALSAWAAYLLACHLCRSFWPSFAAGWIYGFSAYEIGHMVGHLNLVFVPLLPLGALLAMHRQEGLIGRWRFVVLLVLVLTGQFLVSTEVFLTFLLVAALFALLAMWQFDALGRRQLRLTTRDSLLALALSAVVLSPYLVHMFVVSGSAGAPIRSPFSEAADLLNYAVPTRRIWAGGSWLTAFTDRFTATGAERGAYLSLPLLVAVLAFSIGRPSRPARKILGLGLVGLVLASLGPEIRVAGHGILPGPWKVLAKLPVTKTALPIRLTVYISLVVALMVALWLAEGPGRPWLRWAVVLVGVALVLPNPSSALWGSSVPDSPFFADGTYKSYLRPGETVLVLPFGAAGWSLLWQARTDMAFRLVGGHFGRRVIPAETRWKAVYDALGPGPQAAHIEPVFRQFLKEHRVRAIVVAPGTKLRQRRLVGQLGIRPVHAADVLVYPL
jgi:hypothetical protein